MTRAEAYWILEEMRKECFSADHAKALGIAQETIEFVDLMPEHYVPVVRCKDCKHYYMDEEGWFYCDCFGGLHQPDQLDFCSYGERKDGDG